MGLRAFKPCGYPRCPALVKSGMCEKHGAQQTQRQYEAKRSDPVWMMYQTPRWKVFRQWFLRLNPQCQRIIDGMRCEQIADTVHHLLSPRQRPELFLDADNVKAVCREHHHHGEGAGPDEVHVPSNTKLNLEQ